jgi:fumarate reductase subunit C
LFYQDRNTFWWKKKNIFCLFLVVYDAGLHALWWFSILSVVAGEVAAAIKKKKKNPAD